MAIDWMAVSTIAVPIIALVLGIAIDRILERRPNLIAYFTHASAFSLPPNPPVAPATVNTHGIVIKNIGKRPAVDVRVRHNVLPGNFVVFPNIEHRVVDLPLPAGGAEIIFPLLVPNEQVTIAYLYFPPLFVNQIHAGIRHSEGFATEVTTLPTPQYPAWLRRTLLWLLILGLITLIYLIVKAICFAIGLTTFLKANRLI